MRNQLYIILVLLIVVISCNKDNQDYGSGDGSAYLNDLLFNGRVGITTKTRNFCDPDTCIDISVVYRNDEGLPRGIIFLGFIPLKLGKFEILHRPLGTSILKNYHLSYAKLYQDGDVVGPSYMISEPNPNNWIEVSKINFKTGYIEGKFQARVVDRGPGNPVVRDTIHITEGKFYGNIIWGL